jgi:hypothetical protein
MILYYIAKMQSFYQENVQASISLDEAIWKLYTERSRMRWMGLSALPLCLRCTLKTCHVFGRQAENSGDFVEGLYQNGSSRTDGAGQSNSDKPCHIGVCVQIGKQRDFYFTMLSRLRGNLPRLRDHIRRSEI